MSIQVTPNINQMDDEQLTKMAEEELLQEAKRGAVRAQTLGPEGWKKTPKVKKTFLKNTLRSALYENNQKTQNKK